MTFSHLAFNCPYILFLLFVCFWQAINGERAAEPDMVEVDKGAETGPSILCSFLAGTLNILNHEKALPSIPGMVYMTQQSLKRKKEGSWFKEVLRYVVDSQTDLMSLQEVSLVDLVNLEILKEKQEVVQKGWNSHAHASGWSSNARGALAQLESFALEALGIQEMLTYIKEENDQVKLARVAAIDILKGLQRTVQSIVEGCTKIDASSVFYQACSSVHVLKISAAGLLSLLSQADGINVDDLLNVMSDLRMCTDGLERYITHIVELIEKGMEDTQCLSCVISGYLKREHNRSYGTMCANVLTTQGKQDVACVLWNDDKIFVNRSQCKKNGHFIACNIQLKGETCSGLQGTIMGGHTGSNGLHRTPLPTDVGFGPSEGKMIPDLLMSDINLDYDQQEDSELFHQKADNDEPFEVGPSLGPTSLKTIVGFRKVAQIIQNTQNFVDVGVCSSSDPTRVKISSCDAMDCRNSRSCDMCCEWDSNDGKTQGLSFFTAKTTCKYLNRICYSGDTPNKIQKAIATHLLGNDKAKKMLSNYNEWTQYFKHLDLSQLLCAVCFETDSTLQVKPVAVERHFSNSSTSVGTISKASPPEPGAVDAGSAECQEVKKDAKGQKLFCEREIPLSQLRKHPEFVTIDKKRGDIIAARHPFKIIPGSSKIFMREEIEKSAREEASQELHWTQGKSKTAPVIYPAPIWPSDHFFVQAKVKMEKQHKSSRLVQAIEDSAQKAAATYMHLY